MPDRFETYLNTAGEQIRWKRARPALLAELNTHLLDQRDACLEAGMSEEEAQAEAIRQMGDPVMVGQGLDGVHRPKPQWALLGLTIALVTTGVLLRLWLTAGWQAVSAISPERMLAALVLGVAALFGGYFLDYSALGRWGKHLWLAAVAAGFALLLLKDDLLPGKTYYATYLFHLFPLVCGVWCYAWRGAGWKGYLLALAGMAPLVMIPYSIPQLSQGLVIAAVALLLFGMLAWQDWFGVGKQASRGFLLSAAALLILWGLALVLSSSYTWYRLDCALHPEEDPLGYGFFALNVRAALEGAQWMGPGSWNQDYPYEMLVLNAEGNYFLTTIIHKLGWLPFLLLALAFSLLLGWMLVKSLRQKNTLARVTVLAVVLPLLLRWLGGVAQNLSFVLFSVSFPLFSSSMATVLDLALIGLALSVFRQETLLSQPDSSPPRKIFTHNLQDAL